MMYKSSANEVLSASFVEALFSEVVKVIIARKTKYYVHYEYYIPAERFKKAEGSNRMRT